VITSHGQRRSALASLEQRRRETPGPALVRVPSIATAMAVEVRSADVVAEGVFDADDATVDRLAAATMRYCMVGQSLRPAPTLVVRHA
jgi:hypothetical protein